MQEWGIRVESKHWHLDVTFKKNANTTPDKTVPKIKI